MVVFWDAILAPLIRALLPQRILEIGAERGTTTRLLLEYAEGRGSVVHAIDPRPLFDVDRLESEHADTFVFHQDLSLNVIPGLEPVDFALIDGDHNWYTVLNELRLLEQVAREAGAGAPVIALHDIDWPYGRRDVYYSPETVPADQRRPFEVRGLHPDTAELVDDGFNTDLANAIAPAERHSGVRGAVEDFMEESDADWQLFELSGEHGLGILVREKLLADEHLVRDLLESTQGAEFLRARVEAVERARIDTEIRRVGDAAESEAAQRRLAETENERSRLAETLARQSRVLEQIAAELAARQAESESARHRLADLSEQLRARDEEIEALQQGPIKRALRRVGDFRSSTSQLASWVFAHPSRQRLRYVSTYLALRRSGEFDADFYRSKYPDVRKARLNPLMHYVEHGVDDGRDPSPVFSTSSYRAAIPEVDREGINPLLHWLRSGKNTLSYLPASEPDRMKRPAEQGSPLSPDSRPSGDDFRGYREFVAATVPAGGTTLVASDGERELLTLDGFRVREFPEGDGNGAGAKHPTGSTALLANLESLRAQGAEYLVLPQKTREWWAGLQEFHRYIDRHYSWAAIGEHGAIARLGPGFNGRGSWQGRLERLLQEYQARFRDPPSVLDLTGSLPVAASFPELTVVEPVDPGDRLTYLDGSVDVVIVGERANEARLSEARRVARNALIRLDQRTDLGDPAVDWLSEPERTLPTISILIPSYDAAGHLDTCLRGLSDTVPPHLQAEILVIDDGSSDSTPALLSSWSQSDNRIRHVRNENNRGFVDSCNLGAAHAESEVLVFLNNDTIPVNGWLQPLIETLADREDAGAVGGMLLYPNGTVQEAGGVIFSDGSGANFGNGDSPDHPWYRFVRVVDYCSGALLATERQTFEELGGFDTAYRPCYYEDVDYCFALRDAGLRTYYQPNSVVVHIEGGTAGIDLSEGPKRFQAANREKFRERWAEDLVEQEPPPNGFDQAVWARLARRGSR